jgi:ABC-2 type transport system ATP-binding protein
MSAAPAIRTEGLGKRYGSTWALRDCSFEIPAGSVTALVGPNGAGKTTLLQILIGLGKPTCGSVEVLGCVPLREPAALLPRVGFVAQDHPLHPGFTVAEMLKLGRRLNPTWDEDAALARIARLGLPLDRKVGKLSGGQQAQVALTIALAKQPELLLLDEPVASLDPLARREFMNTVMEAVSETELSVVLSSHIVTDLERICDRLVILSQSRTLLAMSVDEALARHRLLVGPRTETTAIARMHEVIRESHTERQSSLLVRADSHLFDTHWDIHEVDLEDIVLAYLGYGGASQAALAETVDSAVAR